MTEMQVRKIVLDVLEEVQKLGGREWTLLSDDAKPIGALDDFDSLSAVEATVMIEEKLGKTFDVDSVFVSKSGKRALTLKEISERLATALSKKAMPS